MGLDQESTHPAPTDAAARLIARVGRSVAWLTLVMVALIFGIVVLRYGFNQGWIALQESVTYLHATVFMLAAAWALQTDTHVRVDIFYRDRSSRYQAWVNGIGTVLLVVPFAVFMLLIAWDYVASSWSAMEGSREAGGLPLVYLLKSLIMVLPLLLLIQSCSTIRNCIATIKNTRQQQ